LYGNQLSLTIKILTKRISRKGAKKDRQDGIALNTLAFFLCTFAPLRETVLKI
jgi:hypothetical protein